MLNGIGKYSLVDMTSDQRVYIRGLFRQTASDFGFIMAEHRQRMENYLTEIISSKKSPVLTDERVDAVTRHLREPADKVDPHFRHWVKSKNFQLVDLPGLGLKEVLVAPRKEKV